jgi:PIN domain nuclease of toxin-antitoxin system
MNRFLLDTHTAIWFLNADEEIPVKMRELIADTNNQCYVSIATAWEIAIKISIGKLNFSGTERFFYLLDDNKIDVLPIKRGYIKQIEQLPLYHRDPFDRLIIATAIENDLTVISRDTNFKLYPVKCIW